MLLQDRVCANLEAQIQKLRAENTTMRLAQLSPVSRRAVGGIVGAIVADAACMPLHWNYDLDVLKAKLKSKGKEATPEFYEGTDGCPYYHLPMGKQSCYG
jgi:hypothetical protein